MKLTDLFEKYVTSTWITDIRLNRREKLLTMTLSNRKQYHVKNITRTTFDRWAKAGSKGKFFHQTIKPHFEIERFK